MMNNESTANDIEIVIDNDFSYEGYPTKQFQSKILQKMAYNLTTENFPISFSTDRTLLSQLLPLHLKLFS